MSMISKLIDELRKSADEWNGSNMFELARMCSEAADTIWQLRDDLQRANNENARLRGVVASLSDRSFRMADKMNLLQSENAKLRELCEDMLDCIEIRAAFGRPRKREMYERFADAARELGVEVD